MKKHVKFKIFLAIITVLIVVMITMLYKYLHSSTIIIQVAPTNANVLINGKSYQNGIFKTTPKEQAEITISADSFNSQTITLDIKKNEVTKIFTELMPNDNNWNFYTKEANRDSFSILLSNNGYQPWDLTKNTDSMTINHSASLNDFIKKVSIKSIMPLQFSICGYPATRTNCDSISINYDYSPKCDDSLCLIISGRSTTISSETIKVVQDKLQEYNYDLNQYTYIYQQSTN